MRRAINEINEYSSQIAITSTKKPNYPAPIALNLETPAQED
jgi:hypothetical protein